MEDRTIIAKGKPTLKNSLQFLIYTVGINLFIVTAVLYLMVTLYYTTTMYGDRQAIFIVSLQKAIIPTLLIFFLYFLVVFLRVHHALKKKNISKDETDSLFIINKEGITHKVGNNHTKINWVSILKIKEHKELFLFRHSFQKWSYLPKHFFQSQEDLMEFKRMLHEYQTHPPVEKKQHNNFHLEEKDILSSIDQESAIIAKGNYTFEEYDQYASLFRRKMILGYTLFVAGIWLWLFKDRFFAEGPVWDNFSIALIAYILLISLIGITLLYFLLKRRNRKEYKSDALSTTEKRYIITEDGVSYFPGESSMQMKWTDFKKVREHKGIFLFYVYPQGALIIPFRLFESPEDIEKVRALIQKHMDE